MKRLYLTVEGQTEAAFATSVLRPHLFAFNVLVVKPRFTGPHRRDDDRIPGGGMFNSFGPALRDIGRWLKEDKSRDARFSMMVDLYHLPHDFPGYKAGMSLRSGVPQAVSMEQSLATELADDRFIPYLQVHEFEALVLADPNRLTSVYDVRPGALDSLCRDCSRHETPEEINHGQHSHPKYRIAETVPEYDANIAGPLLVEEIGLAKLRMRCPHFGAWLTQLEQLDSGIA